MTRFCNLALVPLWFLRAALCQQAATGPTVPGSGALVFESNMEQVEIFVDGTAVGVVGKNRTLRVSGLTAGVHIVAGFKRGYDPDGPREAIVYSGQESTVKIRILIPRRRPVRDLRYESGQSPLARVTGRALIQGKDVENAGYGLYSYLLFARRSRDPASGTYQRYISALKAYLEIEPVDAVRQHTPIRDVNITYLPINGTPTDVIELLDAYDYARAQRLLALVRVPYGDGPMILSTRQPLSNAPSLPEEYLLQDLSTVPPAVVSLWVRQFIRQAAQERFWERITRDQFALQLRTYIAAGGAEMVDLTKAVATLVWQLSSERR